MNKTLYSMITRYNFETRHMYMHRICCPGQFSVCLLINRLKKRRQIKELGVYRLYGWEGGGKPSNVRVRGLQGIRHYIVGFLFY